MRITGCELSRLNPVFSDQSCAMSGDFILLGLALIHGEISICYQYLYLLTVSLGRVLLQNLILFDLIARLIQASMAQGVTAPLLELGVGFW